MDNALIGVFAGATATLIGFLVLLFFRQGGMEKEIKILREYVEGDETRTAGRSSSRKRSHAGRNQKTGGCHDFPRTRCRWQSCVSRSTSHVRHRLLNWERRSKYLSTMAGGCPPWATEPT